ncbi:MAG TPA: YetF domain-containing protein [Flavobacterium sp.]|nr:YetF domain-containing protein [Flavobacterium sp.]
MLGLLDIVMRSVAVYLFMIIAVRITGKKELSQLNTTDVILILLISNAVQNAMVGSNTSLLGGLCAAAVLFGLNFLLKRWLFKSSRFRNLLNQKPEILIHNGKMDFKILSKLEITQEELEEAIREHRIETIEEVKWAIFEIDGNISIISETNSLRQTHYKRKHQRKNLTEM